VPAKLFLRGRVVPVRGGKGPPDSFPDLIADPNQVGIWVDVV